MDVNDNKKPCEDDDLLEEMEEIERAFGSILREHEVGVDGAEEASSGSDEISSNEDDGSYDLGDFSNDETDVNASSPSTKAVRNDELEPSTLLSSNEVMVDPEVNDQLRENLVETDQMKLTAPKPLSPVEEMLVEEDINEFLQMPAETSKTDEADRDQSLLLPVPARSPYDTSTVGESDEPEDMLVEITTPKECLKIDEDDGDLLIDVKEDDNNLLVDVSKPTLLLALLTNNKPEVSEDDLLVDVASPGTEAGTDSEKTTKQTSFVDSLLDKIRRSNSDSSSSEVSKFQQILSESDEDLLVEVEPPVSYSKPSNPNLMPTPIVRNQRSISAFVNNEDEYQRTVAKHQKIKNIVNQADTSQMGSTSEPPQMQAPTPSHIQRPRTLAEKRELFRTNRNIKFLMVEQETKIFKHVQRKKQSLDLNYNQLDNMMFEHIPIHRGPWKVLTWLRTRDGFFIHQYIDFNGQQIKLNGSRGNHAEKVVAVQSTKPLHKTQKTSLRSTRCCAGGKIKRWEFDELLYKDSIRKFVLQDCNEKHSKKIDTKFLDNQLISIKPRPLSKKIEYINKTRQLLNGDEDSAFLGNFSKFEMPDVKMEIQVKHKAAMEPFAKKYLKDILPHRDLTEDWCELALTALVSTKEDEKQRNTFDFTIPYENNKRFILVREILKTKEDKEPLRISIDDNDPEDVDDEMEWTFAKDADKDDPVECEVIDIIKDLTNSVFINLNDDLFTQDDPYDRTMSSSSVSPLKAKESVEVLSTLMKTDRSKRVLSELKRLNANVFVSESQCVEDEDDMRRHATAHLGKVERELRPTVIVTDSDTVLLGNQEKDSRRIKRAPKKFDDYDNSTNAIAASDCERDEPVSKKMRMRLNDDNPRMDSTRTKQNGPKYTFEELKTIKRELNKMLHVNVDVYRLDHMKSIEPWCMVHNMYKCECKGEALSLGHTSTFPTPTPIGKGVEQTKYNQPPSFVLHRRQPPTLRAIPVEQLVKKQPPHVAPTATDSLAESEEELVDDGFSRRVLPVFADDGSARRVLPVRLAENASKQKTALISSQDGLPKLEILNLCDLINGRVGPIFINVYDDKTMRLNPITRSVLNNKSAIVYFDGFGYFVDKTRVDIKKLDFSKVKSELEEPIFIIQGKDEVPPPVSSTMNDDFIKILFRENSNEIIQIYDKTALNEISGIIESILRNVKKKIASKMEGEPNELVKEQLSMLTNDRSRSRSVSSSASSPLSFKGMKLTKAPPPGTNTQLMKEFNQIFSTRMQRLVSLISSNSLGLRPSLEMLNKFYIYKWQLLLQSFEEDLVQIWQVRLESENGNGYQMMALTESRDVPEIEHATKENIVNIRKLSLSDDITELTRLILLRVENAATVNMTVVFYGCRGYLRMSGILNSKEQYLNGFTAKPSRATHPRIAAKIQKTYHIWHASRALREKKADNAKLAAKTSIQAGLVKTPELMQNDSPMGSIAKKPGQSDFKWFLFNITDDFSDIFIKTWSRYLSFKVIMEAINRAKSQNRAVALTPSAKVLKKWPRIYALPSAPLKFKEHDSMTENYLIFGPYMRNSNSNLVLMQNVDGELMLRDDYEKRNNTKRAFRTRCLWIYANTLKCIQDADPIPLKLMWGNSSAEYVSDTQSVEKTGSLLNLPAKNNESSEIQA